jgi:tetratricopeptide (TPR) repeat protein
MKLPGIVGGSTKKALKYADELEKLSPVDGYLAKGFIYDYNNDFQTSEKFYKQAVAIGGSVTCYQNLIDLYVKNNQKEKAISTLEEAYQTHQKNNFLLQIESVKKLN